MRYIWQHIRAIVDAYRGEAPLSHFLKDYFRRHPILGGRDRRMLSTMAYCWYRCSKGIADDTNFELRVKKCLMMCGNQAMITQEDSDLLATIGFQADVLFPCAIPFSAGITKAAWLQSMLSQPSLFIRVRTDIEQAIGLLSKNNITAEVITDDCLALPNGADVSRILPPESYVVQDASSQKTGAWFHPRPGQAWYDCCCGAGGKSLLLKDREPAIKLTVSDRRKTIIHNLEQRFRQYGHKLPVAVVTDAASESGLNNALGNQKFDHIICDAPCSGSGTWARTPEQFYFFNPDALAGFAALQQSIATNVSRHLRPGGTMFYITCSVFRAENEDVVDSVIKKTGLVLLESTLINGITIKADSMYIAVLQNAG